MEETEDTFINKIEIEKGIPVFILDGEELEVPYLKYKDNDYTEGDN